MVTPINEFYSFTSDGTVTTKTLPFFFTPQTRDNVQIYRESVTGMFSDATLITNYTLSSTYDPAGITVVFDTMLPAGNFFGWDDSVYYTTPPTGTVNTDPYFNTIQETFVVNNTGCIYRSLDQNPYKRLNAIQIKLNTL
jgi:hypothetical protein